MTHQEIEGRISNLEINVQSVMLRLKAIENSLSMAPAPKPAAEPKPEPVAHSVVPPPVIERPPIGDLTIWVRPQPEPAPIASIKPQNEADDLEYKFGINGLLRGGAAVIVCAVLFLVALALGRGWITPTMQFVGEILLCLGFIALGIWKIDEREDFGKLMAGIGSFGLYASFAGGYAFKHLYEGETLVALYMLLSLANLGFSHWKTSKSFYVVGMLGGLAAAIMPMHRDKVMLDFALHFMILIPCALIAIKNRWNYMALLLWTISTAALWPATTSSFHQVYRVGATYLNCAICLYACGKTFKSSTFDPYAAFQTIVLVLTGFFAIGIDHGHKGSLHALVLTGIGLAVGSLLRQDEKPRNSTWYGALLVFAILTPIGFTQPVAAMWYALEAVALMVIGYRLKRISFSAAGLATFAFAMLAYAFDSVKQIFELAHFSPMAEQLFLGLSSAAIVFGVSQAVRQPSKEFGDVSIFLGGTVIVGFFLRSLNLLLGHHNTNLDQGDIAALGFCVASLASLGLAIKAKRMGMTLVSSLLVTFASLFALIREPSNNPTWLGLFLLLGTSISVIGGAYAVIAQSDENYKEPTMMFAGAILSTFFVRAFSQVGTNHLFGLNHDTVIFFSLPLVNLIWTGFALKSRRVSYLTLAGVSMIISSATGIQATQLTSAPDWLASVALALPLFSLISLYAVVPRREEEEPLVASVFVIGCWLLGTMLLRQELIRPWIGLKEVAALTVSWVVIATALIATGFLLNRRHLRYWSLAIFMVTVGKVFMVDLAALDSFVRVLMLMLLGIGMVGGGYWYILWKRKHSSVH